jgi:GR25 family glycosyltransferase involved in LPS biosynthesis
LDGGFTLNNMNRNIDHLYYINLNKRVDRDTHIKHNVLPFFGCNISNFTRISAIDTTDLSTSDMRAIGCTLSHLEIYSHAKASNFKTILIIEDDFIPVIDADKFDVMTEYLLANLPDFNVCQIAYNVDQRNIRDIGHGVIKSGSNMQTTSGYILNVNFCDTLAPVFTESVDRLRGGESADKYACDQVWKRFQTVEYKWYLMERVGKQLNNYSDIEGREVVYNC